MNGWDYALLALLAVAVFFALRRVIRARKRGGCSCGGGCGGNCESCGISCPQREKTQTK